MAIDWGRLEALIVRAAVGSINGLLYDGLAKAQHDVPVRRVFQGDRRSFRFKTATEIESDRALRSRLGLAPEILATPEAIQRARKAGVNPNKSRAYPVKSGLTNLETGEPAGRHEVFGFARTIRRRDRANSWEETGPRVIDDEATVRGRRMLNRTERQLKDRGDEDLLSGAGRYELRDGRAVSGQRSYNGKRRPIGVDLATGKIQFTGGDSVGGPFTVGGGLRSTLRVQEAAADQYPVIRGSLVAGDKEHDYAKYQELGTRHNAAHPFLRPRLDEWRVMLPARLRRNLGRAG